MYLFIDTSQSEEIRIAVFDHKKILANKSVKVGFKYSEKLLVAIDSLLKSHSEFSSGSRSRNKFWMTNIKKIFVVEGPGRFSALRTGVNTANVLAWSLGVPVLGVQIVGFDKEYWQEVERLILKKIKINKAKKFTKFLVPQYGQEPNITKPKK